VSYPINGAKRGHFFEINAIGKITSCGYGKAIESFQCEEQVDPSTSKVERIDRTSAVSDRACFPYVRKDGVCLTQCKTARDCQGSRNREELRAGKGWPNDCIVNKCVPLHPSAVE
jgi:hypothetical protein